jgi:hypothetical protein
MVLGNNRAEQFCADPWSKPMLQDIVEAVPLEDCRLMLRFEDGVAGVVDVAQCVSFTGVFAPLRDRAEFLAVRVIAELGTVCWPCGADLDPDVLYALAKGAPPPSLEKSPQFS